MKQIGVAIHSHHDLWKVFPSGGVHHNSPRTMVSGSPANYRSQAWGWAYQILPFLEQQNLYGDASDVVVAKSVVPMYMCPSFRGPTVLTTASLTPPDRAMMDYVGNGGTWGNCGAFTGADNNLDGPFVPSEASSGRSVRMATIIDGTSSTILVGEKYTHMSKRSEAGCNNDQGYVDGWDNDAICFARNNGNATTGNTAASTIQPPLDIMDFSGPLCGMRFGSIHGSLQVVFCDGSVHAIGFGIDQNTWLNLCSVSDGNVVPPNDIY